MDFVKAIRLQAIRETLSPTADSSIRKILRWYSATFNTSLTEAYDLPLDFVLQAYYESTYEDLPEEQLREEVGWLLKSDEEKKSEVHKEEVAEVEDSEFLRKIMEEEAKRVAEKKEKPEEVQPVKEETPPEPLPDIKMNFDSNLFNDSLDVFGQTQSKKK